MPKQNVIRSLVPTKIEIKREVVDLSESPEFKNTAQTKAETVLNPFQVVPKKREPKPKKIKENPTVELKNKESGPKKVFTSVKKSAPVPGTLRPVIIDGMNVLKCVKNEFDKDTA